MIVFVCVCVLMHVNVYVGGIVSYLYLFTQSLTQILFVLVVAQEHIRHKVWCAASAIVISYWWG